MDPAPILDPATRLRPGVDPVGETVTTAAGVVLRIRPASVSPQDVLRGRVPAYAAQAQHARDTWAAAELGRGQVDGEALVTLAHLAILDAYEVTMPELVAWLPETDSAATVQVCLVAIGRRTANAKARARAIALVLAGLGDCPLSAAETAQLADWSANHRSAPLGW